MRDRLRFKVRPLDPKVDWFFHHQFQPLRDEDRAFIQPVVTEDARSLWQDVVSSDPRERHPMLLPRGHWLGNIVAIGPDWQDSWPPTAPDRVADFLRSQIDWAEDSIAYFIWMREQAVKVRWGAFLRCWRAFLFSDEGPFLIRLRSPEFVTFPPIGSVLVGRRDPTTDE